MFNTMKDVWNSLVSGFRERTTNPLTFAFVIGWSLWNYKFFLVLFGELATREKLQLINELYPEPVSLLTGHALLYPLIAALAYVFVYPYVGRFVIQVYREQQIVTANLLKNIEGSRILTADEVVEMTRRHEKDLKRRGDEVANLSAELNAVRRALEVAEEKLAEYDVREISKADKKTTDRENSFSDPYSDILKSNGLREASDEVGITQSAAQKSNANSLAPEEKALILEMSDCDFPVSGKELATRLNLNFSVVDVDLKSLQAKGWVTQIQRRVGAVWELTPAGRDLAVTLIRGSQ